MTTVILATFGGTTRNIFKLKVKILIFQKLVTRCRNFSFSLTLNTLFKSFNVTRKKD
jgi:hypothetical protein